MAEFSNKVSNIGFFRDEVQKLHVASTITLIVGILVVLANGGGGASLAYLVHSSATELGRKTIRVCLWVAPTFGFMTLGLYLALTKDFGPDGQGLTVSAVFWLALFATGFSTIPVMLFEMFVNTKAIARIVERKNAKENFKGYGYGA